MGLEENQTPSKFSLRSDPKKDIKTCKITTKMNETTNYLSFEPN